MTTYNIEGGDRVRITDGRFKGHKGIVIHKFGWAILVLLDGSLDSFTTAIVYIEYLEKLKED